MAEHWNRSPVEPDVASPEPNSVRHAALNPLSVFYPGTIERLFRVRDSRTIDGTCVELRALPGRGGDEQ